MANKIIRQTSFATGQVDINTWKRTDAEKLYLSAAQSLLNCEVGTTALARKRRGTQFSKDATAYATANSRMYEFIDKNGNHYLIMSADQEFTIFDVPTDIHYVIDAAGNYVINGDGSFVVAYSESVDNVQTISTPYLLTDLDNIDYTQENDSLVLTHPDYKPGRIYISNYSPLTFSFQYLDISPYPTYDFNTINYSGFTATFTNPSATTFRLVLAGVGAGDFTTDWINGQIVSLGTSNNNALGYGTITGVTPGSNTVTFDGNVVVTFDAAASMPKVGSQYVISQPAWSDDLGWPAKCLYFQNRLWLANTSALQNTIFGSKINAPVDFSVGVGRDTDAIVYTIGQTNSGEIRWINGGKQLEIYCANFEFACPQDTNTGLTPSSFSVRQQSSYGASPILKPVTYLNDSYFVTITGKSIVNFHFTGVGLSYESTNISAASVSLVKNPSNRALLRGTDLTQDNFIYFCNPDDDTLTAFQFAAQVNLAALTPVEYQHDADGLSTVNIIDIVTVDNQVFILKYYTLTGIFTIEQMVNSIYIDSNKDETMQSSGLVTGLSRLNGYTAQVVYQDQDYGQYLVVDGEITVDNPDEIADTVQVGLLFDVEITPMYLFTGANQAPFFKQLNQIYVDYIDSLNFYVNDIFVQYQSFAEIQAGIPLTPQTGTAIVYPVSGYNRFSTFSITQSAPFDLIVTSIAYLINSAAI